MIKKHRPYWKGYLRLGFATIGVDMFNAVESNSGIKFRQIHKPTGKRINQVKVVDDKPIDNVDIVKGYEVDDERFMIIEPDELDQLKLESKKTIDLVQFVDEGSIDPRFFERPYYLAPTDAMSQEGFAVVRDAMKKTKKVALSQVTIGGREWLIAIAPFQDGFVMTLLRYQDELRAADSFFEGIQEIKPNKQLLDMATQLIQSKSAPFNPAKFQDGYQVALKELIAEKLKGNRTVVAAKADRPIGVNVVDLTEALRRSLAPPTKAEPKKRKKA